MEMDREKGKEKKVREKSKGGRLGFQALFPEFSTKPFLQKVFKKPKIYVFYIIEHNYLYYNL